MDNSHESKLNAILKAIEALTTRTKALENLASRVGTSQGAETFQPMQYVAAEDPTLLPSQENNCSNQNLGGGTAKFRESKVSLPEKFDNTQSKF